MSRIITHTSVKMFWQGTDQNQKQQFYLNDELHRPTKFKHINPGCIAETHFD